jgi:hypothetical protein
MSGFLDFLKSTMGAEDTGQEPTVAPVTFDRVMTPKMRHTYTGDHSPHGAYEPRPMQGPGFGNADSSPSVPHGPSADVIALLSLLAQLQQGINSQRVNDPRPTGRPF